MLQDYNKIISEFDLFYIFYRTLNKPWNYKKIIFIFNFFLNCNNDNKNLFDLVI